MLVGDKVLFQQIEIVLVLLFVSISNVLASVMLNVNMDIECVISTNRFASGGHKITGGYLEDT